MCDMTIPTRVAASSAPARVAARSRLAAGAATVFLWSTIAFTARLLGPVPASDARPARDTPIRPTDPPARDLRPRTREWAGHDGDRAMPAIGTDLPRSAWSLIRTALRPSPGRSWSPTLSPAGDPRCGLSAPPSFGQPAI